jgi:cobalt/nickel transport system permease protein
LRQATFAQWSNQASPVHRFDARLKLLLLIAFVISIALLRSFSGTQLGLAGAALVVTAWIGKLPVWRLVRMSLLVLPFVGLFSVIVYLSGDTRRAAFILVKSYLSALAVVVTVSSTPLPQLLAGARFFRLPALLVDVTQLIYRYLFVLSGEAQAMRTAFLARGGHPGRRAVEASSGMVAVLFSRSYEKAVAVHNAMAARGFSGGLRTPEFRSITVLEILVLLGGLIFTTALHFIQG